MAVYYNEIDPFAAAWLRELIKAGEIADGVVDERSIVDVRPDDLRGCGTAVMGSRAAIRHTRDRWGDHV